MAKREISNLDLKVKLTNEYLRNGGVEKIFDPDLLQDIIDVKFDGNGKADPDSVTPRLNAFMLAHLMSHSSPPFHSNEHISEYASTLQKSLSFDQENIDTIEQFDDIYDKYKEKAGLIFRGQREAKWRLYNKLQRQWIVDKLFKTSTTYEILIRKLIDIGKTDYAEQIKSLLDTYHVDSVNDIAVLGYLQHHGCPTPLMDWTFKFQNALFFAIDGLTPNPNTIEIQDYCSVYFIEQEHLKAGSMRFLITESLEALEKPMLLKLIKEVAKDEETRKEMEAHFDGRKVFDKKRFTGSGLISHMTVIEHIINTPILYFSDDDQESGIVFSLNNSKNIQNQAGVFVWNHDSSKPIEMVGDEQYPEKEATGGEKNYRFCKCYNINKKLEQHIRKRLTDDGVTREFIYPTPEVSTWDVYENSKQK
jgi:hypothetical protein